MKNDRFCIQKLNGVEAKLKNEQNTLSELCADGPMAELNKVLNKNVEKGEEKSEAELNNEGDQEAEPNTSELRLGGPNTEVNNAVEKSVEKCVEMSETELNTVSELRVGGTHDPTLPRHISTQYYHRGVYTPKIRTISRSPRKVTQREKERKKRK